MPLRVQSGEMFDLSIGSFNNPFGRDKILNIACEGMGPGLEKYIHELGRLSDPTIARSNPRKEQKRLKRLELLEECNQIPDLQLLFQRFTAFINGVRGSIDEFDENPVVVTVAGGNIYTIFAGLILGIQNNDASVLYLVSQLVSMPVSNLHQSSFSSKLLRLCTTVVSTGFSDLDFNLLPSKSTAQIYLGNNGCGGYDSEGYESDEGFNSDFGSSGDEFSGDEFSGDESSGDESSGDESGAFTDYRSPHAGYDSSSQSDTSTDSESDDGMEDLEGFALFRIKSAQNLNWNYSARINAIDGCTNLARSHGERFRPGAPDKLDVIRDSLRRLERQRPNAATKRQIARCKAYLNEMRLQREASDQLTKRNANELVTLLEANAGNQASPFVLLAQYLNNVCNWMNIFIYHDARAGTSINPNAFDTLDTIISDMDLIDLGARLTHAYANDPTMLVEQWADHLDQSGSDNLPASVFLPRSVSADSFIYAKRLLQSARFGQGYAPGYPGASDQAREPSRYGELGFPDGIRISLNFVETNGPANNPYDDEDDLADLAAAVRRLRFDAQGIRKPLGRKASIRRRRVARARPRGTRKRPRKKKMKTRFKRRKNGRRTKKA